MVILFGHTPGLRQKNIRQFWLGIGIALVVCVIIGVLLYVVNKQGRI
jgi:uncharacterized membrane-anchored protein YhcB (DUF1043 family)